MRLLDRILRSRIDPPHADYRVQLLLPRRARVDPIAIRNRLGGVELVGANPTRFALAMPFPGSIVHVYTAPVDAYAAELESSLRWSQTWRDRREVVARAQDSFVIATALDPGPAHAAQLRTLHAVIDALLCSLDERDAAACILHWMPAQQVMPCIRYRLLCKELGPSGPIVNVRIVEVEGTLLADTIGFAPLGLPDLQARFRTRDPNEVALHLMLLAKRVFAGEKLDRAAEERHLAPPARDTLTIALDPTPPAW